EIVVTDDPATGHGTHDGHATADGDPAPSAGFTAGWRARDPRLAPAPAGTVHTAELRAVGAAGEVAPGVNRPTRRVRATRARDPHTAELRAVRETVEVAPGVKQQRWTSGGTAPGPTLRGKVGDVFEITLVNDDPDMGHGIDFHAGSLAPDRPMRTIEPGERL